LSSENPVRRSGKTWRSEVLGALGILPVLVLICVVFALLSANFATANNAINVLRQASINVVLAAGMTFVILTAGIDLSVGAILGASAVVALQVSLLPQWGWAAIPAGLMTGLAFGLINGLLIAYLRLSPFVVTLGAFSAVRGAAYLLANNGQTVINSNLGFAAIGNDSFLGVPWLVWIALAVILVSWFILRRTVLGVHVYAVGGNEQAARLTGIKVHRVLLFAYAFSGLCAGLAGVMSAARLYSANGILGTGYELDAIAAVVLGGTSLAGGVGSVLGTAVGAMIIAVLNNGLTILGVSSFWQLVVKGVVIVIAVAVDRLRSSR
jgi:ribose transport system permease protein